MSWLIDIAGKAEDLLNKVDKTAATALQNKSKSVSTSDVFTTVNSYKDTPRFSSHILEQTQRTASKLPLAKPARLTNYDSLSRKSPIKKKKMNVDDQLLEYLNSGNNEASNSLEQNSHRNVFTVQEVKPEIENRIGDESSITSEDQSASEESLINVVCQSNKFSTESVVQHEISNGGEFSVENSTEKYGRPLDNTGKVNNSLHRSDELILANTRAEHAESELRRMQKKLEHWNSQISDNDKSVRDMMEREFDLAAALDAKDSQLAVLKVRLEEADQEILNKRNSVIELNTEIERLRRSYLEETTAQNQAIEGLKERLRVTEEELTKSREACHAAQTERLVTMSKMEEQHQHLVDNVRDLQKKKSELNERNKELLSRLQLANSSVESLQKEYSDYRQKAQRILQSKEKLITSLKEGNLDVKSEDCRYSDVSYAVLCAEMEGIKQERDLFKEELTQANEALDSCRNEIQEIEKMFQNDSNSAREHCKNLEDQLVQERSIKDEIQLMNSQLKEEIRFAQEDLSRTKNTFENRIKDREVEIEKLRKQLTTKSMSSVSQDELESRLHALTENLIHKQTIVETLSTEKNSLTLQLERLEQRMKESQMYGSQHHTVVGVSHSDTDRRQKPVFADNPLDSNLTRKVKKVYGTIDSISIRLGVFFRRYPAARMFVFCYMFLLHLWVMIVLLTYEPEMHNSSYKGANDRKA